LNYEYHLALPLLCLVEDLDDYNRASKAQSYDDYAVFTTVTRAAIDFLKNNIKKKDLDSLLKLFEFYKVPIGFLPKLLNFAKLDVVEFIIDDSKIQGDQYYPQIRTSETRLVNTLTLVKKWTHFLSFIPGVDTIVISYTSGEFPITKTFSRGERACGPFAIKIHAALEEKKTAGASDSPLSNYDSIVESFETPVGDKVARFMLAIPFVSDDESQRLMNAIALRNEKKDNPVTFLTSRDGAQAIEYVPDF
jgi:hypothetical protein